MQWRDLAKLPVEVLPHTPDAARVDAWQFQLWLGLRAAVFTTGKPLSVEREVVEKTLELWRVNLAESEQSGGGHRAPHQHGDGSVARSLSQFTGTAPPKPADAIGR